MAERDARYVWLVDNIGWPYKGAFEIRCDVGYYARQHKWTFAKYGFKIVVGQFLTKHFAPPKLWYYFKTEEDKAAFQEYLKT